MHGGTLQHPWPRPVDASTSTSPLAVTTFGKGPEPQSDVPRGRALLMRAGSMYHDSEAGHSTHGIHVSSEEVLRERSLLPTTPGPVLSSGGYEGKYSRLLGRSRDRDAETVRMLWGEMLQPGANTAYSDNKPKNTIPAGQKGVREKVTFGS